MSDEKIAVAADFISPTLEKKDGNCAVLTAQLARSRVEVALARELRYSVMRALAERGMPLRTFAARLGIAERDAAALRVADEWPVEVAIRVADAMEVGLAVCVEDSFHTLTGGFWRWLGGRGQASLVLHATFALVAAMVLIVLGMANGTDGVNWTAVAAVAAVPVAGWWAMYGVYSAELATFRHIEASLTTPPVRSSVVRTTKK